MAARFETALALIDEANAADPNMIETADGPRPAELLYGQRMSETLVMFRPDAPETLRLAVRAQHLKRWTSPRSDYPMDRQGYHAWRNAAKRKHADDVAQILTSAGYTEEEIATVQSLIRKEGLKRNPDAQTLEDVACLVFMKYYFSAFSETQDHEKMVGIVRKSWGKMSEVGQRAALEINFGAAEKAIVEEALGQ